MKNISRTPLTIALMAACNPAGAAETASPAFESAYYKDWPLFSTYAREPERTQPIEHFGPVGIGIELLLPPFQMKVSRIDKGSPAEACGKHKVGQMIESINGQTLKDIDPRVILGGIITKAEATDGVIKFLVKEKPETKAEEVVVKIPVLGAYSKTWPLNEAMVRKAVAAKPLLSADWQALQDPGRNSEDPEVGKFKWDGKSVANPLVSGVWTTVAVVPSAEAFDPAKPTDAGRAPFKEITFNDDGFTSDPLRRWSGDTMIDLTKLQALKMTLKDKHLSIEAGGFSDKNLVGWKSPLIVMKKK